MDSDQCQFELSLRIFHGLDAEHPYEYITIHLDPSQVGSEDTELLLCPTTTHGHQWVDCRITRSVALGPDEDEMDEKVSVPVSTKTKRAAPTQGQWLVDHFVIDTFQLKKKAEDILAMRA